MPTVSVIIPNYNHAQYLKQRIDSVLYQTYQDFELIILDDCSSDSSRNLINRYKEHPKVSAIIFNETNSGSVYKQWQKGIELSKGDFIWIAESDDYCSADFLSKLISIIEPDHTISLIYSDSVVVYDNKTDLFSMINSKRYHSDHWNNSYINSGNDEIKNFLSIDCTINNASAVIFRKTDIASFFPIPDIFRFSGDHYIYLNVIRDKMVAFVSSPLNYCRYHDSNTSKKAGFVYVEEAFFKFNWMYDTCLYFLAKHEIALKFARYAYKIQRENNVKPDLIRDMQLFFRKNFRLYFSMISYSLFKKINRLVHRLYF